MSERRIDFPDFHWLDVSNPSPEVLERLAAQFQLHPTSVQDCLQPEHLPKYEMINDVGFVVLRSFDSQCTPDADTVQELTCKIAIFYSNRFVITIHRKEQTFLHELMGKLELNSKKPVTPEHIMADILSEVVRTYDRPIYESMGRLEAFEMEIFGTSRKKFRLENGYYLKRQVSVLKRMLRLTMEPVNGVMATAKAKLAPEFQNVREHIDSIYFYADEISESMSALLNLHVSLASQKTNEASAKTNEVMRVLTIFSCFFLPINFIASIYGMNFEFMPELRWQHGYAFALSMMGAVILLIMIWFRRKGWMRL